MWRLFEKFFRRRARETVASVELQVRIYKEGNWVGDGKVYFEYCKGGMSEFDRDCLGEAVDAEVKCVLKKEGLATPAKG